MGLSVAVFADSTSRWAEAFGNLQLGWKRCQRKKVSQRHSTRLAQFYERGVAVITLGGIGHGSIVVAEPARW